MRNPDGTVQLIIDGHHVLTFLDDQQVIEVGQTLIEQAEARLR
jgi:hypothetical protein